MSYEPTIWKKGDKVTSTKLNKIENGIQGNDEEITSIKSGLNAMSTATSSDVGKALKAKTITNGKVTEWEFGEAGGGVSEAVEELNTQMAMLIDKTPIEPEPTGGAEQVVDLTGTTHTTDTSGNWYYGNAKIQLPYIGAYYSNPSGLNISVVYAKPYDANGNTLTVYRNGTAYSNGILIDNGGHFELIDRRTIKTYKASGALNWTWTTDADIAYLSNNGNTSIRVNTNDTDESLKVGYTYGEPSITYVEYGSSVDPDTPTEYEYNYSEELMSAVHDGLIEGYTDAEPTEGSNNFVKSGGVVSYAFKDSYNLVDPTWFDWSDLTVAYIGLKTGVYIPVVEGQNLLCNCAKVQYKFYDTSKTQIGTGSTAVAYNPVAVPTNAECMTVSLNNGTDSSTGLPYIPSDHNILIYYSDKAESPTDDRRLYVPHKNLQGWRGSAEIFDFYAPTTLDSEILKMAQFKASRLNGYVNNSVRIASCNLHLPQQPYNWEQVKNCLADHAIDICAFQEVCGSTTRRIGEFLKGWQFPYSSTIEALGIEPNNTAQVSFFKITSCTWYQDSYDSSRKYCLCIYELPKYGDKIVPTLAVMDYHGILYEQDGVPGSQLRPLEITEMLAILAEITTDFKIVLGDTNAMDYTEGYPNNWKQWADAGYTPVFGTDVITCPSDNKCIDNIFLGSGMTALSKHVIPSTDYPVVVNDPSNPDPLTDHNIVFADIQFDFDSLIRT